MNTKQLYDDGLLFLKPILEIAEKDKQFETYVLKSLFGENPNPVIIKTYYYLISSFPKLFTSLKLLVTCIERIYTRYGTSFINLKVDSTSNSITYCYGDVITVPILDSAELYLESYTIPLYQNTEGYDYIIDKLTELRKILYSSTTTKTDVLDCLVKGCTFVYDHPTAHVGKDYCIINWHTCYTTPHDVDAYVGCFSCVKDFNCLHLRTSVIIEFIIKNTLYQLTGDNMNPYDVRLVAHYINQQRYYEKTPVHVKEFITSATACSSFGIIQ